MPFKHQMQSYRTRKGVRFECDGDILDATFGDLLVQAKARVNELREAGMLAFYERQDGGWYRVFCAPKSEAA